ncbi:apolipoprotein L6-like [Salminus brasiliensis]|uniref:apolipoprotein L6-like n=1 Tax=Salminus brasiliensis TaxID=930266 RepID=UPI003B833EA3
MNFRGVGQPLPGLVPSICPTVQQSGEEQLSIVKGVISVIEANAMKSKMLQDTSEDPDQIQMIAVERIIERVSVVPSSSCGAMCRSYIFVVQRAYIAWEKAPKARSLSEDKAAETFREKARCVKKALRLYDLLLSERKETLCGLIAGLMEVSDNLNKVHKGVKIAGITGGAAGAAGVAAAVGGILLAPLTLGASLAVTAVGVGVAAAGGVTGASAAITNKVNTSIDRRKVEKILQDYTAEIEDIENCVTFISSGMEYLNSYNMSEFHRVDQESVKMAKVAKKADRITSAMSATSKSSGLIQGFALGMDIHFTKDDNQKLKKGSETKFAKQVREVAKSMATSLDKLVKVKSELKSDDV